MPYTNNWAYIGNGMRLNYLLSKKSFFWNIEINCYLCISKTYFDEESSIFFFDAYRGTCSLADPSWGYGSGL